MTVLTSSKVPTYDCFSGRIDRWFRLTAVLE